MASEDRPQGGVHLNAGFGGGPLPAKPSVAAADVAFTLTIVGDFGGIGDGRFADLSASDLPSFMASFGAVLELEVANRLGSAPPALAVRLPIASIRDLDPRTIAKRVPEIAEAERLVGAARHGKSAGDFAALARAGLDHVAALLQPAPAQAWRSPSPQPVADDDHSLDRLLDMVDLSPPAAEADMADTGVADMGKAAVSAFVSQLAKPENKPEKRSAPASEAANQLLAEQANEIAAHPAWLAAEAAWRSLQTILAARGGRHATHIQVCDVRRQAVADLLGSAAFADHLADEALHAILVLGAYDRSDRELEELDRLAVAAESLATPVIVSLDKDFLGTAPDAVAGMDNPAALLDGRGYEAWRGLRGRDESRWIFAAWNDFVLRPESAGAPGLWGEPGVIVAAQVLRSLARAGWPTEVLGAETALGGLEIAEASARGGRKVAIPLRCLMDIGVARDLAYAGVIALVCRADRDQAWLTRASSLFADGAGAMSEQAKAMESLGGLPFRFISAYFETLLSAIVRSLRAEGVTAAGIAQRLDDTLLATGSGASAHVTAAEPDPDDEGQRFEVSIRLGQSVMGGFAFSLDMGL